MAVLHEANSKFKDDSCSRKSPKLSVYGIVCVSSARIWLAVKMVGCVVYSILLYMCENGLFASSISKQKSATPKISAFKII